MGDGRFFKGLPVRATVMAGGAEPILLSILLIVLGAKLGGEAAERIRQPAVLGELLMGVVLGASLLGPILGLPDFQLEQDLHHEEDLLHAAEKEVADIEEEYAAARDRQASDEERAVLEARLASAEANLTAQRQAFAEFHDTRGSELSGLHILSVLATIGVILLLFEVGLESDIKELTKVGMSSLLVGIIGIVASFAVGYGFSWGLSQYWSSWHSFGELMGQEHLLHIFVGATLTATSVGITARVLGDMGRLNTRESRIILGAAVIDDIGGLIILAIVAAMVTASLEGGAVSALAILKIAAIAIGFLVVSLLVGLKTVPRAYDILVERFQVKGFPVALAISFALLMAYLATLAGLADIVGAFAGGLILAQTKHHAKIFDDLRPIAAIFVSFFFVTLGMKVDLRNLGDNVPLMLAAALALTAIAIAAKLACGWGVTKNTRASRLIVGVGMAPRGEVGLIFASLGLATGLIANWQYTMVIIVVMLTTFVTPIWLKRLQDRFLGSDGEVDERTDNLSQIMEV
jgi:Kef-type K+ transport system membrane component KefB